MSGKVVDRHINVLSFLQPLERGSQERDVKGIRVIKIVLIPSSPFMLLLV